MKTIAKLYTFYVMNAKTEMNYIQSNISEKKLYQMFNQSLNFDDDDDDNKDNEINENDGNFEENKEETLTDYNKIIIENYFDINNIKFQ